MDEHQKWLTEHLSNVDWETVLKNPDPMVCVAAIVALQQAGSQAAAYARRCCSIFWPMRLRTCASELPAHSSAIGGLDALAKDRLVRALGNDSARVRVGVAHVLWKVAPDARTILPILVACLEHEDAYVRWNAATALGDMGQAAMPCATALELALHDRDDGVQMHAGEH